jgi:opacity protein-like surface antigen
VEGNSGSSPILISLVLFFALTPAGSAQDLTVPPPNLPRIDVSASIGWLGHHPGDEGFDSDDWNARWYGGAQVGYYWNEHLKTEAHVGLTSEGESWVVYPANVAPRPSAPHFTNEARRHRDVMLSVGQTWQFLHNQWVHPFVGGGVDVNHARLRRELHTFTPGDAMAPQISQSEEQRWHTGVHGIAGVKVYFTTRSFVRFDGRIASGQDGQHVTWRVGLGTDF